MRGSWSNLLFLILIALGAIGLFSLLWYHPVQLLRQLLIGVLIMAGIYALYRLLTRKSGKSSNESKAYRRAVKQSKRRKSIKRDRLRATSKLQVIPNRSIKKKRPPLERLKHKGHGHLTVIEGKKKKRKKGFL